MSDTKKHFKKRLIFVIFCFSFVFWALLSDGGKNVELTYKAEIQGDILKVSGNCDLPEGSLLTLSALSISSPLSSSPGMETESLIKVGNGYFEKELDLSSFPDGEIDVSIYFYPTRKEQPEKVVEEFGKKGEKLEGENLIDTGDYKAVWFEKIIKK